MTRLLAVLLLATSAFPASAQQPTHDTYVLVHGAWGGSWDWRTVDSLLTAQGHRVHRVDLTGLGKRAHLISRDIGLDTHIEDVVNEILWEELDDVVLLGHSYGGMVITGVADSIPDRIRELIYVDAMLPEPGESVLELVGARAEGFASLGRDGLLIPGWAAGDSVPRDVPHPLKTFQDEIVLDGDYLRVAARYILTAEPARQPDDYQPMADRARRRGIPVLTLESGHVPERTHPDELVALILGN